MSFGQYDPIFKKHNIRIEDIPIVDATNAIGSTSYIDQFKLEDMKGHSIVKFTDKYKRKGFCMVIDVKKDKKYTLTKGDQYILCPFQRYTDGQKWSYGWGGSQAIIEHAINEYHNDERHYNKRPFGNGDISHELIDELLSDTNPYIHIKNIPVSNTSYCTIQ